MPGSDELISVRIGAEFVADVPPNGSALEVFDADGVRTVVINAAGALVSALVASNITTANGVLLSLGTANDARFSWDVTDANAQKMLLQLPAGSGTKVPVLAIGQLLEGVDLAYGDGLLDPTIALYGVGARATGPTIDFRKSRGTAAAPTVVTSGDDIGRLNFYGAVASGEYVLGASIRGDMVGTIATTRGPSTLTFLTATDAAPSVLTAALTLNANQTATFGGAPLPSANDASALGVSGTAWADLFLASGAVINFNAGNATITHSTGTLTSNAQLVSAGWRNSGAGFFGLGTGEAVTIASGVATVTKPIVNLVGEGATTDTLDSITYTNSAEGDLLLICVGALGYTITADNSSTLLLGAGTRALVANSTLLLRKIGTTWIEVAFLTAAA